MSSTAYADGEFCLPLMLKPVTMPAVSVLAILVAILLLTDT